VTGGVIDAGGRSSRFLLGLLIPVAISQFLISLDFSCLAIVIPVIAKETGAEPALLQWTISGASLVWGGCLILGGRIADRFGNRRIFVLGLTIYCLGALAAASAASIYVIIAGRVLSGLGGALFGPAILAALIDGTEEGRERHLALVVYSIAQSMGSALGVASGGVIAADIGWRMVFGFMLLVAVAAIISAVGLPRPRPRDAASGQRFDIPGAALITLGCSLLVFAFSGLGRHGLMSTAVLAPLAAAAVLLMLFLAIERRAAAPILPPRLLRVPGIAPALLVSMATNSTLSGFYYILAIYLHQIVGMGTDRIGVIFCGKLIGVIVAGALMARLLRWLSPWAAMATGCLATTAIMLSLTQVTIATALWMALVTAVLIPIGHMMAVIATTNEITTRAPAEYRAVASAVLLTSTQIAVALAMGLYASALGAGAGQAPNVAAGFATGAAIVGSGMTVALIMARRRRHREALVAMAAGS
jgi:MFS family permease